MAGVPPRLLARAVALILLVQVALPSLAQPASAPAAKKPPVAASTGGPSWASLTPAQRTALAPLERDWATIGSDRKEKWLEISARFPTMSADERQRVQARMTEWARLSPKERGEARLHYQEARQLSPSQRQARWEAYQALPPDQRRALAERAAPASSPVERPASGKSARAASAPVQKSNIVATTPPAATGTKPVAPTVMQVKPGATTTLMSKTPAPPAHQQPGLPKVTATPGFVDRTTLLPQKGAQAAGTRAAAASSPASARP